MDKIILNNNTELEFNESIGLELTIKNKTTDELEELLTIENLSKVQIVNSNNEVYGDYSNLKFISITKFLNDGSIVIKLAKTSAQ